MWGCVSNACCLGWVALTKTGLHCSYVFAGQAGSCIVCISGLSGIAGYICCCLASGLFPSAFVLKSWLRCTALVRFVRGYIAACTPAAQVRLRAHLLTLGLSVAVTAMGVLWQWSTSHGSSELSSLVPWLWELLLRLSVGCLAPTILLYWWELDERTMFLASKHCSYGGRLGGSDGGFAPAGKAKAA